MLKIKDNVDLKKLEKFKDIKKDDEKNFNSDSIGEILIDINAQVWIVGYEIDYAIRNNCDGLGTLYDLIKADLVEKVEE